MDGSIIQWNALDGRSGQQQQGWFGNRIPSPTTSLVRCSVCGRIDCNLATHKALASTRRRRVERMHKHAPLRQIADEQINPFARHPIKMTPELERLYALAWSPWNSDFRGPERHLYPKSRYSAMFTEAWHDEAMLYGILSSIATQISLLRDGVVDQLALNLQGRAIAAQRIALATGELSDARVTTALCIMSNSNATNSGHDLSNHFKVIAAWLQRRGGLDQLGMGGIVADNLMLADSLSAVIHNHKPRYSIHLPALTSSTAPKAGPGYTDLGTLKLLQDDVVCVASHYLILVSIFDRAARGIDSLSESTYFGYLSNVVEYGLACANEQYHDTNTLDECIILSVLIGNHTLLRNHRQLVPCMSLFEVRFWRCLDELRRRDFFVSAGLQELECYLVCIGTLTSVRRPSSFRRKTVSLMTELRKVNFGEAWEFHQFCLVMEKYGWSHSVCVKLYSQIWEDSSDQMHHRDSESACGEKSLSTLPTPTWSEASASS